MMAAKAWAKRYQRPIISTNIYINKVFIPSINKLKMKKIANCLCIFSLE